MSGEKAGKNLIIEALMDDANDTWKLIGGLQSKTFSLASEGIEVTNHDSEEEKEFLDGAGIKSGSLSGNGIAKDDSALDLVENNLLTNTLTKFRLIEKDTGKFYVAFFKITTFERTGEYNGAHTYSIALESSGKITRGVAPIV